MITQQQRALMRAIDDLAFAAHEQTGYDVRYSKALNSAGWCFSTLSIYAPDELYKPEYRSEAGIKADGTEIEPYLPNDRTLEQQRDELASWIASHRKEAA